MGDHKGALAAYGEDLAIARKLAAAAPKNLNWLADVNLSLRKIGNVRLKSGDRAGALAAYLEALEISRRLVAANSKRAKWRVNLGIDLYNLSLVSAPAVARTLLAEASSIFDALERETALEPDQKGWPKLVRESLDKLP